MTPKEAAAKLRQLGVAKNTPIVNAVRRFQTAVVGDAIRRFRSRGMGRSVFGRKNVRGTKGVRVLIKRGRVRDDGDVIRADMTLKGLAALQEMGGKTAPHPIRSHRPSKLLSRGPGGGFVASTAKADVKHPGSRIQRMPFFQPAVDAQTPRLPLEIEKGVAQTVAKLGLN